MTTKKKQTTNEVKTIEREFPKKTDKGSSKAEKKRNFTLVDDIKSYKEKYKQ